MTGDDARRLIARVDGALAPGELEALTREAVRLGPQALGAILGVPEVLFRPSTRHWVVHVALQMDAAQVVAVAVEALAHPDWRAFQVSGDILVRLGARPRDALVAFLQRCGDPVGRCHALHCLGRLADPFHFAGVADSSLIPVLADRTRDAAAEVRAAAVECLSQAGSRDVAGDVVPLLVDPDETVRREAVRACGRRGLAAALEPLAAMAPGAAGEARADILHALERIGDVRAAAAVRAALADADPYVRWTAAAALRRLWEPANVGPLRRACGDGDAMVAIAALETLALRAPAECRDLLARARDDPREGVRETARHYGETPPPS